MSREIVQGLCGLASYIGLEWVAVAMLLGWHCLLQTAELSALKVGALAPHGSWQWGTLTLENTKSGKRRNVAEVVSIDDPHLMRKLRALVRAREPTEPLWPGSPWHFRKCFGLIRQLARLEK